MNSQDAEQLATRQPAYLADYGLAQVPFAESHEDRFLYLDTERAQRLNLIQHTLQYSNLMLIVKGEDGVGKTSLLTRFLRTAATDVQICVVTANPMMDAGQLLYQAAKGFDIRRLPLDSGDLQGLLDEHIASLHHLGRIPLLVVDDAHTLPRDALLALYNLADAQIGGEGLLRIMLLCTAQMDRILAARDMRALRERVTHTMEIPPLDEVTTAGYLKHRLAVAGFNGTSPFTAGMVKRIYKASGGIPGRINQLALEALDTGNFNPEEAGETVEESQASDRKPYRRVFALLVVIIALVAVIQYRLNHVTGGKSLSKPIPVPMTDGQIPQVGSEIRPAPASETGASSTAVPAQAPVQSAAPASAPPHHHPLSASTAPAAQREQKIIPLNGRLRTPDDTADSKLVTASTIPATASANQNSDGQTLTPGASQQQKTATAAIPQPEIRIDSIEPNPVPASRREQTLIVRGSGFTQDSRVHVSWADHDKEIPPQRVKFISDQRLEVALTVGTGDQHWQLRVNDRERGNSNSLGFDIAPKQISKQHQINAWVLGQDPAAFTLQLFGSHDLKNVETFIQQHQLGEDAHYFLSVHNGGDWYSVVYGVYPDQGAAHKAISTLPASLSKTKPWVRRFDDIQSGVGAVHTVSATTVTRPVKPPPSELASAGAVPGKIDVSQYESWIWSQDPSSFTLQLMGAHDEESIRQFLQKHRDLAGKLVYFKSRHAGGDWYTVIYGVYADKQKAADAIRRLPSALQKGSPWIRRYASIHTELSRSN